MSAVEDDDADRFEPRPLDFMLDVPLAFPTMITGFKHGVCVQGAGFLTVAFKGKSFL